jgi:hypothetical protein
VIKKGESFASLGAEYSRVGMENQEEDREGSRSMTHLFCGTDIEIG